MRVPQKRGLKGSLRWMQALGAAGSPLEESIRDALELRADVSIDWRSPLPKDSYAEYRDQKFLKQLGLERLGSQLAAFWPDQGPQWDGLAVTSKDQVILIEAKSHLGELVSHCAASAASRITIENSLSSAKQHFGARTESDWTAGFYQYANRLAHLWFLRKHGVDAHLIFAYFLNDRDMRGPTNVAEWNGVLTECYERLGLRNRLIPGVHNVFLDVGAVATTPTSPPEA
jgi:hypothetical protein